MIRRGKGCMALTPCRLVDRRWVTLCSPYLGPLRRLRRSVSCHARHCSSRLRNQLRPPLLSRPSQLPECPRWWGARGPPEGECRLMTRGQAVNGLNLRRDPKGKACCFSYLKLRFVV